MIRRLHLFATVFKFSFSGSCSILDLLVSCNACLFSFKISFFTNTMLQEQPLSEVAVFSRHIPVARCSVFAPFS